MPGTTSGGKLAGVTNRALYGDDYYSRIGSMGGKVRSPKKGFGGNRELARRAGAIGGRISKRTKRKLVVVNE